MTHRRRRLLQLAAIALLCLAVQSVLKGAGFF
jgi:hypothetical protein